VSDRLPQAYHLVNEHSLPLGEAVEQLKEILGVELREVGYDEWRTALCNAPETNVLLPLAAAFRPSGFPRLDQPVDCSNTLAALDSLAHPSSRPAGGTQLSYLVCVVCVVCVLCALCALCVVCVVESFFVLISFFLVHSRVLLCDALPQD
jgi:hypothetical protein